MEMKLPQYEILNHDISETFMHLVQKTGWVAIDTETRGLKPHLHRMCTIQLYTDNAACIVIVPRNYNYAINVCKILKDSKIQKIFHYAYFDIAILYAHYNNKIDGIQNVCDINNIYCTKIASKIACTYTSSHSLKSLCERFLGITISKAECCSTDWGCGVFEPNQISYMLNDVLHLYKIKQKLDIIINREELLDPLEVALKLILHKSISEHRLRLSGYEPTIVLEF